MGMGEPLLNYDNTVIALRALMDPDGFAVAPKKLTLSTVGILPALEKLMQEPVRPNLAISLHAPTKELRLELMPIEERYDIKDVIAAAQRYPIPRGGRRHLRVRPARRSQRPARARARPRAPPGRLARQGEPHPLNPAPEIPFAPPDAGGRRRVLPHPLGGARARLRAPPARAGHPRRLRPAPPQARGGARARPRRLLSAAFAARAARLPWAAQIALVLALAAAVLLPSLAAAPLTRAEIYFMDGARGMVETGDWLVPRYQGEPFFDKPRADLLADGGRLPRLRVLAGRGTPGLGAGRAGLPSRPRPGWAACSWAGAPPSTARSPWARRSSS